MATPPIFTSLKINKNNIWSHNFNKYSSRANVKIFLQDFFGISPSYDISLDDIALAYSSPDPDKWGHIILMSQDPSKYTCLDPSL